MNHSNRFLFSMIAESEFAKTGKPPKAIIDDQGVTHYKEVPLPAEYGEGECECGSHPLEADTWYHSTMDLLAKPGAAVKIVRRCKKCHEVLLRKIKENKNE